MQTTRPLKERGPRQMLALDIHVPYTTTYVVEYINTKQTARNK